jgi:putative ABC transport system permease protein
MLNNHFRILLRGLWNKKSFSLLNILGLSVGIAASLLIFLVIHYETGFDSFHANGNRIYRVVNSLQMSNGEVGYNGCNPLPMPAAIHQDFPQFEQVSATWSVKEAQFAIPGKTGEPDKKFREKEGCFYTEPSLFRIFDFPWLAGNPDEALKDPNTVALTRSVAEKWFGNWKEAIGRTVLMGDIKTPFRVTGVLKDPPSNTDIPLRIALSYTSFLEQKDKPLTSWGYFNSNAECFVLLARGQNIRSARTLLPAFQARYFNDATGFSGVKASVYFQPLKEIHFDDRFETYGKRSVSEKECWALGLIGLFLILIACINFINISTARSISRSKEIGVRKVLGSSRSQLLLQFLQETALTVFVAVLAACFIARLSLPFLNGLMGEQLTFDPGDPVILLYLFGTWVIVTFLAGFYPGMVLSAFAPIAAIRNKISFPGSGSIYLRRGLVILQFSIAQILLIGTLVIVRQMNYFRYRPMGFDSKAIAIVDIPGNHESRSKYAALKTRILQVPGVEQASLCGDPPSKDGSWSISFTFGTDPNSQPFNLITRYADTSYIATFHLNLLAGRYPVASDTIRELAVNAATVRKLGLKEPGDILNKFISFGGPQKYPVVGVLADFNNKSLREEISPLVISPALEEYEKLAIRLDPHEMNATIGRVRTAFAEVFPDHVFDYTFFDDSIMSFYRGEAITSALFKIFAAIAILISCLGLYGLISLMTAQKTREVGIRKVLGASVARIVYSFSMEFTYLVGISFLIAAPLGSYVMSRWLSGFYYRIDMGWGLFALTLLSSGMIAWITVGYKAVKAAITNPVKSLRAE